MAGLKIRDLMSSRLEELDMVALEQSLESKRTVLAREEEGAEEVAERFDAVDGELVVVVDEEDRPRGVVDPEQVRVVAAAVGRGGTPQSLTESLKDLAGKPPADSDRALEAMRSARPNLYLCPVVPHYVSRRPCRDHEL